MGQGSSHDPARLHKESELAVSKCNIMSYCCALFTLWLLCFAISVDKEEIHNIKKTWEVCAHVRFNVHDEGCNGSLQDLADRTNGKGVDKETFLQYFPITGLLGGNVLNSWSLLFILISTISERLFAQFDLKKTGFIDLDEFVIGIASFSRFESVSYIRSYLHHILIFASHVRILTLIRRGTTDEKIRFLFSMYDTDHLNTVSRQELTTLLNQGILCWFYTNYCSLWFT
jgi:Ca2+-binding EF-hand superfamily protein